MKHRYEMAPHVFQLAEMAYRQMLKEDESQCIIISGESGAGKTEASKKARLLCECLSSVWPKPCHHLHGHGEKHRTVIVKIAGIERATSLFGLVKSMRMHCSALLVEKRAL
jgi:hypothetical protein